MVKNLSAHLSNALEAPTNDTLNFHILTVTNISGLRSALVETTSMNSRVPIAREHEPMKPCISLLACMNVASSEIHASWGKCNTNILPHACSPSFVYRYVISGWTFRPHFFRKVLKKIKKIDTEHERVHTFWCHWKQKLIDIIAVRQSIAKQQSPTRVMTPRNSNFTKEKDNKSKKAAHNRGGLQTLCD